MSNGVLIGGLIVSFLVLAQGADILVANIKAMAARLRVPIFFLGLLLGLFTSMPELILGISSSHYGLNNVALGNLLGGIIVLFGLVLGLAIIFNRQIKTDGHLATVAPGPLLFLLPLILGLKGWLNRWDGLVMIIAYLAVVYYNYGHHQSPTGDSPDKLLAAADARPRGWWRRVLDSLHRAVHSFKNIKLRRFLANRHLWLGVFGFLLISFSSQLIISFSSELLRRWGWSPLLVGVLIFSIGTNLPEIAVTMRALIKKAGALSISHLIGSAVSNVLIIGVLLQFGRIPTKPALSFGLSAAAILVASGFFLIFYKTDKCFRRWEGVALLAVYLAFIASQLIWAT